MGFFLIFLVVSNLLWPFSTHLLFLYNPLLMKVFGNGILLPKLFRPTVKKKCSSDREKLLKFEAEGRESAKFLQILSLHPCISKVFLDH